jgi:hypothetical protein
MKRQTGKRLVVYKTDNKVTRDARPWDLWMAIA